MNQIEVFRSAEFELRITPIGDSFRIEAPGLARALGFREGFDLVRSIPDDEKGSELVRTPGGEQRVWYLTEPGFYRALGQRQAARVKDDAVRVMVERFQNWVYREVLPAIRREGGYISPAATSAQLAEIQMRVLRTCSGIVDASWLEAKARHVAARALGEEPEVDPARRPLTVGEYLVERGITGVALRTLSPKFGKWVKAEYRRQHGRAPMPVDRFVDGALRKVAGYTEADRSLFDRVWNDAMQRAA